MEKEEEDRRREAAIASSPSLQPNFNPKGVTQDQLAKFRVGTLFNSFQFPIIYYIFHIEFFPHFFVIENFRFFQHSGIWGIVLLGLLDVLPC